MERYTGLIDITGFPIYEGGAITCKFWHNEPHYVGIDENGKSVIGVLPPWKDCDNYMPVAVGRLTQEIIDNLKIRIIEVTNE